jgi:hypothetical protein
MMRKNSLLFIFMMNLGGDNVAVFFKCEQKSRTISYHEEESMKVQNNPKTWLLVAFLASSVGCNFYGGSDEGNLPSQGANGNQDTTKNDTNLQTYSLAAVTEAVVELQALQVDGLMRSSAAKLHMQSSGGSGWGGVVNELKASGSGWGGDADGDGKNDETAELSLKRDCELGGHFTSVSNPQLSNVPTDAFKSDLTPRLDVSHRLPAVNVTFSGCTISNGAGEVVINGSLDIRGIQTSSQFRAASSQTTMALGKGRTPSPGDVGARVDRMELVSADASAQVDGSITVDSAEGRATCSVSLTVDAPATDGTVHLTARTGQFDLDLNVDGSLCNEDVQLNLSQLMSF